MHCIIKPPVHNNDKRQILQFDAICFVVLSIKLHLLHTYSCCICGNRKLDICFLYWRRPILKCAKCGLKFALTRHSLADVKRNHGREYWSCIYKELGCDYNPLAWKDWQKWKGNQHNQSNQSIICIFRHFFQKESQCQAKYKE